MNTLRPAGYQLIALTKMLLAATPRLLITDGVGVGKTISAGYCISWMAVCQRATTVVICPVSLVDKWINELRTKFGIECYCIRSDEELKSAELESEMRPRPRTYVIPYSRLPKAFKAIDPQLVVIDEIHNFRNADTQSWLAVRNLVRNVHWRIGLSATPINNRPEDLQNIFSILYAEYPHEVVSSVFEYIWETRNYQLLGHIMTRFSKEQLGLHFARRRIRNIDVVYPSEYTSAIRGAIEEITGRAQHKKRYPFEAITYYRAAASSIKAFEEATEISLGDITDTKIAALLEQVEQIDEQVLIFCDFRATAAYVESSLHNMGRPVFVLTGDVAPEKRAGVIDAFRKSVGGILVLTSVGAEGLDLQTASTVINYDMHWNPMVIEQRIGRIDRVGQSKDEISVINFNVVGSIDERVREVLERKVSMVSGTPFQARVLESDELLLDRAVLEAESSEVTRYIEATTALRNVTSLDLDAVNDVDERYCELTKLHGCVAVEWMSTNTSKWRHDVVSAYSAVEDELRESRDVFCS